MSKYNILNILVEVVVLCIMFVIKNLGFMPVFKNIIKNTNNHIIVLIIKKNLIFISFFFNNTVSILMITKYKMPVDKKKPQLTSVVYLSKHIKEKHKKTKIKTLGA